MLPVAVGKAETQRQILFYTLILVPILVPPWPLEFAGAIYGVVAIASGVVMILLATQLRGEQTRAGRAARRLFRFSIFYLFLLFVVLLVERGLTAVQGQLVV
jgi:heme o synthase